MSTIIIGGGGKAAVQKLVTVYPHMTAEQKAVALALEQQFVADVNAICSEVDYDPQDGDSQG